MTKRNCHCCRRTYNDKRKKIEVYECSKCTKGYDKMTFKFDTLDYIDCECVIFNNIHVGSYVINNLEDLHRHAEMNARVYEHITKWPEMYKNRSDSNMPNGIHKSLLEFSSEKRLSKVCQRKTSQKGSLFSKSTSAVLAEYNCETYGGTLLRFHNDHVNKHNKILGEVNLILDRLIGELEHKLILSGPISEDGAMSRSQLNIKVEQDERIRQKRMINDKPYDHFNCDKSNMTVLTNYHTEIQRRLLYMLKLFRL